MNEQVALDKYSIRGWLDWSIILTAHPEVYNMLISKFEHSNYCYSIHRTNKTDKLVSTSKFFEFFWSFMWYSRAYSWLCDLTVVAAGFISELTVPIEWLYLAHWTRSRPRLSLIRHLSRRHCHFHPLLCPLFFISSDKLARPPSSWADTLSVSVSTVSEWTAITCLRYRSHILDT